MERKTCLVPIDAFLFYYEYLISLLMLCLTYEEKMRENVIINNRFINNKSTFKKMNQRKEDRDL